MSIEKQAGYKEIRTLFVLSLGIFLISNESIVVCLVLALMFVFVLTDTLDWSAGYFLC